MGNLKFDFQPAPLEDPVRQMLLDWKGDHLAWMAGSTMAGEEEMLLQIYELLREKFRVKLLIAPRHPQRFNEVASLIKLRGIRTARRSAGAVGAADVLLLDSIGELASCYELADLVFIGGTYANFGGHNPIEPAFFGKAILTGTHYSNFRSVFEELQRSEAICITADLAGSAERLLRDSAERTRMGEAAKHLVEQNRGATECAMKFVRRYLDAGRMVEPDQEPVIR